MSNDNIRVFRCLRCEIRNLGAGTPGDICKKCGKGDQVRISSLTFGVPGMLLKEVSFDEVMQHCVDQKSLSSGETYTINRLPRAGENSTYSYGGFNESFIPETFGRKYIVIDEICYISPQVSFEEYQQQGYKISEALRSSHISK